MAFSRPAQIADRIGNFAVKPGRQVEKHLYWPEQYAGLGSTASVRSCRAARVRLFYQRHFGVLEAHWQ